MATEVHTKSLNIIGLEWSFCANSISTAATVEFIIDFFPYGLFPFRSIREQGGGVKRTVPSPTLRRGGRCSARAL